MNHFAPALFFLCLSASVSFASQGASSSTRAPRDAAGTTKTETPKDLEKDRRAILAMLGEYEVTFDFRETVVLKPGYHRQSPKISGAHEAVVLVEDSGKKIVLQHFLVSGGDGKVTKHWRQDWTFEAPTRFEFAADQTWRVREIPVEKNHGAWTQCVYEVSDAPRYCGTGKWNHRFATATWSSDRTWRPLPRREYTQRSDYNALNVMNRHTVTPTGWTHEQDNTKTVREGETTAGTLVRESGFNDYRRISSFDFSPAYAYWKATQGYWARVRNQWDARFAVGKGVSLKTPVDGLPIIESLFEQAERVEKGEAVADAEILAVFERWVGGVSEPGAAGRPAAISSRAASLPAYGP